jgi:hypothetical protein
MKLRGLVPNSYIYVIGCSKEVGPWGYKEMSSIFADQ